MTRTVRHAFFHLALIALFLRGFLPVGWMPAPPGDGHAALVICTMDGPLAAKDHAPNHAPADPQSGHDQCPFAGAAPLAPPAAFALLAMPASIAVRAHPPQAPPAGLFETAYPPQSPRAPPLNI